MSVVISIMILICMVLLIVLILKQKNNKNQNADIYVSLDNISAKNQKAIDNIKDIINDFQIQQLKDTNLLKTELNEKIQSQLSLLKDELNTSHVSSQKEMNEFKEKLDHNLEEFTKQSKKEIGDSYTALLSLVTKQLNEMKLNMSDNMQKGFDNNNKAMGEVNLALGKISAAQSNLDSLKEQVVSLNNVLTNTQKRGRFGEVALGSLLEEVYGDTHNLYHLQFTLKNGSRPDAVVTLPSSQQYICIDSKFSLDHYWKIVENKSDVEKDNQKKAFKKDLQNQIRKISDDYVSKADTASYAIMFIPSDGIYSFIQADNDLYNGVVTFARSKNVIITSPSTLQPILANIRMLQVNYEVSKNIKEILKQVDNVRKENKKFSDDWSAVSKSITALNSKKDDFDKRVDKFYKETNKLLSQAEEKGLIEDSKED